MKRITVIHNQVLCAFALSGKKTRALAMLRENMRKKSASKLWTDYGQRFTETGRRYCGAVGFSVYNGDLYIFKAKATVIATGFCGYARGDGDGIAYRAGADAHYQGISVHLGREPVYSRVVRDRRPDVIHEIHPTGV
jgi:hypothetical protein